MEQPTSPLGGGESEMDFSMSVCSPEAMAYSLFEERESPPPSTTTAAEVPIPPPPPLPPVPVNLTGNRTASVIMSAFPIVTIPQTTMVTPTIIQVQQIQQVPQPRLTLQPIQTQTIQSVQPTVQHTITPQQLQQLTVQQQLQLQQQLQQQGLRIQGQPQLVLTQAQNQPIQQVQLQQQQQQQQVGTQQQLLQRQLLDQQQKQAFKLQQQQPVVQQLQTVQQQLQHKKQQMLQLQQAQIAQQGQQIQVQQSPGTQPGPLQLQQLQQQQLQQQIQQQQQQMQQQLLQKQQQAQQQQQQLLQQQALQQHEQQQVQQQQLLHQQQQEQRPQKPLIDPMDLEAKSPQHSVEEVSITENLEKKKDVLALRLKLRRPREELVSQGIMPPLKASPGFHEQRQRLERAKVGDSLQRKIRLRPEKSHLVNQHILADTNVDPLVNATQQRLKRSRLEQDLDTKIKNRPGPLELIEGNILKTDNALVEQAVKDGKVKFLKTNSLDSNPFEFEEDSQEGFSDEALSPSQSEVSQAESQLSTGSLPSAHSSSAFGDNSKTLQAQQQQLQQQQQHQASVSSPSQLVSPKAGQAFITIKQEPGLISPPPVTSNSFTPISAVSNISLASGGKVTPSPRQPRKKQTKRPKPKEIKFHEYKPPNEQSSKVQQASTVNNPYNLLLMQQQLYLQLQLLQQQQLILPNTANQKHTTTSASSSNTPVTSAHTSSNSTVTTTAAPAAAPAAPAQAAPVTVKQQQPDTKPSIAASQGKPRSLSNLEDMKVSELKLELKNRGLHVSGTKPQLVERLRPYMEQQVTTSASSPNEVSTTAVTSSTRVSSSTDLDVPFSETTSSAQGSLSTPPISPEFRSSLSVTSEPMSPGSAFDPMSPPTFQGTLTAAVCSPDTVSTTNQQTMSGSGQEGSPFDPTMPTLESPQPLPPASSILPVDMSGNDNSNQDMMDLSSLETTTSSGGQISSDILRQQQLKIQELERMLKLSQMQLQMQKLQQPNLSTVSTQQQQQQQSPAGKPGTLSPHQLQQDSKPSAFMFHSKDFAHTLNQQPKVFSFASPPPNGQPFLFSKQQSPDNQSMSLPNGMVVPKAASLPSSPTERNVLGIGSGMTRSITQPTFANPPPNYEEAVRQVKERKSQGNSPVSGSPVGSPPKGNSANIDPRSTKSQDLDDLLEVLVDHGYQIPITPKFRDMQRTLHNSNVGATTVTHSVVRGRGGSIDLKLPVPGPSPPPPVTHSYPTSDLPMEVDPTDLNMSSLDLGDAGGGLTGGERTCRTQSVPFDIPMTTIDGCSETTMDTGKDAVGSASGVVHPDGDLNWLDLVIPSSATGLTPVSATPPTFNMDGAFGATLGKDPFPLNLLDLNDISTPTDLHHLEDDAWDNIPITE